MDKKDRREIIKENQKSKYQNLFSEKQKAEAFDQIAENYYFGNFATMSKSDLDTLMFSLYLDRMLESNKGDIFSYSNHNLSKLLGITPTRIASLKRKKELQYPALNFEWRESLQQVCRFARYDDGKVILNAVDDCLYDEIANAIDEKGGHKIKLDSHVMMIPLEDYIDVMLEACKESNSEELFKQLKSELAKHNVTVNQFEKESVGNAIRKVAVAGGTELCCSLLELIPVIGTPLSKATKEMIDSIRTNKSSGDMSRIR